MSLRKEKAARLKVQVLEQTIKLLGKKPFEDLYVEDICEKVKISKVTFFKYFPQKEDVLMYYLRVWCLRRAVELRAKPKEGLQAINYLLDCLATECETHPGMMLALIGYLADFKRSPKPFPLKAEEKVLLFPGMDDIHAIEIISLDQMLEKFTLEAIFRKEITRTTATRDVTNLLLSVIFGSIITSHTNHIASARYYFKKNLELTLKGLQ